MLFLIVLIFIRGFPEYRISAIIHYHRHKGNHSKYSHFQMKGSIDPNSFDNASLPSIFNPQKKQHANMGFYWAFIGPFCFVIHLLRDSLPKLQSSTGISGHASKLTKKVFLETSGPKVPGSRSPLSANDFCAFWATLQQAQSLLSLSFFRE